MTVRTIINDDPTEYDFDEVKNILAEDGTWFDAYEETSIFKLRASVTSGATTKQNYYSLDYVKNQVDDLLNHLEA